MKKSINWNIYGLFLIVWLLYAALTIFLPSQAPNIYHLSYFSLLLLKLSIVVPFFFIWWAFVYGIATIRSYATLLKNNWEAKAFQHIWEGLAIILVGSWAASFLSPVKNYLGITSLWYPALTVLGHYLNVIPFLLGVFSIFLGSLEFIKNIKVKMKLTPVLTTCLIALAILAWVSLELVFTNKVRTIPGGPTTAATYYLSDSLIVLTIFIPLVAGWVLGVLGIYNLAAYHHYVKGFIYKSFLRDFVMGLSLIVFFSILIQFLGALGAERFIGVSLQSILILVYFIIIVDALAYLLIARGAHKLAKIESV